MAAYFHVDPDSSGGGDGSSWATSGGSAAYTIGEFITELASASAGDVYFIKPKDATTSSADIVMTADIVTANDGTINAPIMIIGVNHGTTHVGADVVYSDFAQGDARPYFDGGTAYSITLDDFAWIRNIRIESTDNGCLRVDAYSVIDNCESYNDYATARSAVVLGGYAGRLVNCDVSSTNGSAVNMSGHGSVVAFCYIHDSALYGADINCNYNVFLFNVWNNLSVGIEADSDEHQTIFGNTFYDCDIGVTDTADSQAANAWTIINNCFSECDNDDILMDTECSDCFIAYNNHYNSGDAHHGVPQAGDAFDLTCDWWALAADPEFTTPGSDFSLQSTSDLIDAGMALTLGVG